MPMWGAQIQGDVVHDTASSRNNKSTPKPKVQWYTFYSEKHGKEFYYEPNSKISTWEMPKEDEDPVPTNDYEPSQKDDGNCPSPKSVMSHHDRAFNNKKNDGKKDKKRVYFKDIDDNRVSKDSDKKVAEVLNIPENKPVLKKAPVSIIRGNFDKVKATKDSSAPAKTKGAAATTTSNTSSASAATSTTTATTTTNTTTTNATTPSSSATDSNNDVKSDTTKSSTPSSDPSAKRKRRPGICIWFLILLLAAVAAILAAVHFIEPTDSREAYFIERRDALLSSLRKFSEKRIDISSFERMVMRAPSKFVDDVADSNVDVDEEFKRSVPHSVSLLVPTETEQEDGASDQWSPDTIDEATSNALPSLATVSAPDTAPTKLQEAVVDTSTTSDDELEQLVEESQRAKESVIDTADLDAGDVEDEVEEQIAGTTVEANESQKPEEVEAKSSDDFSTTATIDQEPIEEESASLEDDQSGKNPEVTDDDYDGDAEDAVNVDRVTEPEKVVNDAIFEGTKQESEDVPKVKVEADGVSVKTSGYLLSKGEKLHNLHATLLNNNVDDDVVGNVAPRDVTATAPHAEILNRLQVEMDNMEDEEETKKKSPKKEPPTPDKLLRCLFSSECRKERRRMQKHQQDEKKKQREAGKGSPLAKWRRRKD